MSLQEGRESTRFRQVHASLEANPTNVGFFIYIPEGLGAKPPILVNPHWCHGSAQAAYEGSQFASLADKYGFIIIYPDSPNLADKCWDVSSAETLSHDGGGDSQGIVSMVRWTIAEYAADASRVFVCGVSSGAMMTNVLVGAYPDVFAAGSAFAGVPFGCFAAGIENKGRYGYWNNDCATGKVKHTSAEWKSMVEAAYPGYAGWRPKLQLFHGETDEVVYYANFGQAIKQWTAVFGLSETPSQIVHDAPLPGWTRCTYGAKGWLETYSGANVMHNLPIQEATVMNFTGLACGAGERCFKWGDEAP